MIFSKEEPYESPETCFFGLFSLFLPHQPPVFRPETLPMKPIPICRVLAALLLLPLFAAGRTASFCGVRSSAGRVVNLAEGASGAVLFNTEDPFALKNRMAARVSPEANDFHFVFRTAYTTGMTGIYGDFFDLIVSPGDSVYVTIDAGRMRAGDPDAIRFSGDHARTNNALASVAGLKRRLCEQAPAVEGDPQEYLASYRRYRQAVADSLSARRLPAEVREAVARDIDMVQIWNHDLDPAAWRAIFTDPMFDIFDLERNMVSVINYSAGISYYLGAICPDEIEAVRSGAAPAEALAAVAARLDADPQIGRGLRDYLLYGCMEGMRANGAVPAEPDGRIVPRSGLCGAGARTGGGTSCFQHCPAFRRAAVRCGGTDRYAARLRAALDVGGPSSGEGALRRFLFDMVRSLPQRVENGDADPARALRRLGRGPFRHAVPPIASQGMDRISG